MRPDQITNLNSIEEQLVDLFKQECTPEEWKKAADQKAAYLEKKNASATINIIARIQNVLRDVRRDGVGEESGNSKGEPRAPVDPADELEREAAALARQGRAVLKKHGVKVH
jgi:hypothetical protein